MYGNPAKANSKLEAIIEGWTVKAVQPCLSEEGPMFTLVLTQGGRERCVAFSANDLGWWFTVENGDETRTASTTST